MFVFFDSCWHPLPKAGPQPAPRPHVHNSGWVQDPGREVLTQPARLEELKPYVMAVLKRFGKDKRVHCWDLFKRTDNDNRNSYGATGQKIEAIPAMHALVFAETFQDGHDVGFKVLRDARAG